MKQLLLVLTLAPFIAFGQVTDVDGKIYKTVKIGEQVWMAENLDVSHFRNGDVIRRIYTKEYWITAYNNRKPGFCYYNFGDGGRVKRRSQYGKLYNWWAIIDPRGLAPQNWSIPSYNDFAQLYEFLGGGLDGGPYDGGRFTNKNEANKIAHDKLCDQNTVVGYDTRQVESGGDIIPCSNCKDWNSSYRDQVPCHVCKNTRDSGKRTKIYYRTYKDENYKYSWNLMTGNFLGSFGGDNTSGFSAKPSGSIHCIGSGCTNLYKDLGTKGYFWTKTKYPTRSNQWVWIMQVQARTSTDSYIHESSKERGYSVRCIKD